MTEDSVYTWHKHCGVVVEFVPGEVEPDLQAAVVTIKVSYMKSKRGDMETNPLQPWSSSQYRVSLCMR